MGPSPAAQPPPVRAARRWRPAGIAAADAAPEAISFAARQFSGIIVIVVVALIVVGVGFLFRDRITGDAGSLKVGDCFRYPA